MYLENVSHFFLNPFYDNKLCFVFFQTENKFRRTIQYAISLGGDTDTIASMAGAIAGAYHGEDEINKSLISYCEGAEEMVKLADGLHKLV